MSARRLVLLRHAKAENPPGRADKDRPLSARGHSDAQAAGVWLAANDLPDLVLCSPSKRTRQTWHGVAANLPARVSPAVSYDRRIYHGGLDDLISVVREIENGVHSALLIGHNPALSQLAFELDPEGRLDSDGLRTCGLTVHTVDSPWSGCGPGTAPIAARFTARGDR